MSAGPFQLYNKGHLSFFDTSLDFQNDTIKCILLDDTYPVDLTQTAYSDVSGNEITDADYSPATITNPSITASGGVVTVTMDTIDFGNSVSIQAKYGVLVRQAGSSLATDDLLIAVIDLDTSGGMVKSTTSDFKIDPAADGMFTDQ